MMTANDDRDIAEVNLSAAKSKIAKLENWIEETSEAIDILARFAKNNKDTGIGHAIEILDIHRADLKKDLG